MDRYYHQHETVGTSYMSKVYAWMFLALLLTATVSIATLSSPALATIATRGFLALFLVELGIVFGLSARVTKLRPGTALVWFLIYAALNGVVLTPIVFAYTGATIALAFAVSALSFGVMSVYGMVTKTDLTRVGSIAFLGLIGIIIASLANLFLHSQGMNWIISYAGVAVFTVLTAWDTQRIKNNSFYQRYSVMGSLSLYLDFINIFLFLLSIFGGGGRRR
ncbi:Bax inhibitor-1/YccA family protein [Alicyclobacillus tolerans]|uniref:Bax inhibitor-1/YccA family protein n=1 Tax=Alicyclobacillus tolerans TaxID=90970 RepID=UPI001F361BF4|nr:Bax inhibitor-1/YccA family protein [Alicyclobacillus tolerans]MCF8567310.1 Bax inhibitor-1/YccA family protein [Alicyclobacillus tolerans]